MVAPEPALAPVMPPVIAPTVQLKLLATEADNAIFGPDPLQVEAVGKLVTIGAGLTVTVIVKGDPPHKPATEVGVTIYSTDPKTDELGFVSTWLIVLPDPALAPEMPPITVPIVQVYVLAMEAVKLILAFVPLHMALTADVVTTGAGLTVTVIVYGDPAQEPIVDVGVTI
jgi:hypothetical protein